jgi:hypothetical protein
VTWERIEISGTIRPRHLDLSVEKCVSLYPCSTMSPKDRMFPDIVTHVTSRRTRAVACSPVGRARRPRVDMLMTGLEIDEPRKAVGMNER